MNKLQKLYGKPAKPGQPAKLADRRLALYRRLARSGALPIWRRGTLVLVP
jgi:hypothetical protein